MKTELKILSSLVSVFPDDAQGEELRVITVRNNEPCSFQAAFSFLDCPETAYTAKVKIEASHDLGITVREVKYVPVLRGFYGKTDDWLLRQGKPGLYPDALIPVDTDNIRALRDTWKSLWITVNEDGAVLEPGEYNLKICIECENASSEKTIRIKILPVSLPKQTVYATNWLHCDCIAADDDVEMFSKQFMEKLREYISLAAKNGQNVILTPMFTPPLDTPVGEERMTAQLVGVKKNENIYTFDFSLADEFIDICLECGIKYFEHSHLFTQWGAEHAPKIVVCENGEEKNLFGWHTDARGDEYREFLKQYISALKAQLRERELTERFIFHVSDEPSEKHLESYKAAADFIHAELPGFIIGDALASYKYYESGLVTTPVVSLSHADDFLGRAENMWVYFTGMDSRRCEPNRLITMDGVRNRILGVMMYYYDIKGFLQWGFNFHFTTLSRRQFDPYSSPDALEHFVAGTSYLVYPGAVPSIRLNHFRDAMRDIRALSLCEEMTGRENTMELIEKHFPGLTFQYGKVSREAFEAFLNDLDMRTANALQSKLD